MSSSSDGSCKSKVEAVIMDSRPTRYMSLPPKKKKKNLFQDLQINEEFHIFRTYPASSAPVLV